MSVLIKGMKMPKACLACPCFDEKDYVCKAIIKMLKKESIYHCRPEWCPLVAVPPHGRLIDADEAKKKIRPWSPEDETNGCTFDTAKKLMHKLLNDTPTIIEAEEGET